VLTLWDIDGTLVLTGGSGSRALGRACQELHGFSDALAHVHLGGKTDPIIVDEVFQHHAGRAATVEEFDALMARYIGYLEADVAASERYRVLPGVDAALAACTARGAVLGLASGNVEAAARIKLERGQLWHRFGFGGYGSDAGDRAVLVARAIERGERHAGRRFVGSEIVVIGDTPRDVAAAHACGAICVAVATGSFDTAALAAAGADVVLETLEAFPAWLAGVA
jgi:phosphoglycolate phosphatase-like HAD superfamily hydrolase